MISKNLGKKSRHHEYAGTGQERRGKEKAPSLRSNACKKRKGSSKKVKRIRSIAKEVPDIHAGKAIGYKKNTTPRRQKKNGMALRKRGPGKGKKKRGE